MIIFLIVIVILGVFIASLYNKLVRGRNAYQNAFSQIDIQLQRRLDLIPNLLEIAKKYMAHEKEVLEAVSLARSGAAIALSGVKKNPDEVSVRNLIRQEEILDTGLTKLLAVAEAYPELKANQSMMQLSEELSSTENKVSFARQSYNDAVMSYNNAVGEFPSNMFAGAFGFTPAPFYKVSSEQSKSPVKISFE